MSLPDLLFILQVLLYCLQKNHPNQPNIIADTLLVLPLLRENSNVNTKGLAAIRNKVKAEMTPLLSEMMQ